MLRTFRKFQNVSYERNFFIILNSKYNALNVGEAVPVTYVFCKDCDLFETSKIYHSPPVSIEHKSVPSRAIGRKSSQHSLGLIPHKSPENFVIVK